VYYDEEIIVRTRVKTVRKSVIVFNYELARAATGALLAEGETTHVVTNTKMKAAALPEKYLNLFRQAVDKRSSIQERS
jgi:acyl-CoA thioesterase FadM